MPFFYLHDKKIEPKSIQDFKYLYYISKESKNITSITLKEEPGIKYCPHKMQGKVIQWNPDDELVNVLGHEGIIEATFKKIANHKKFEMWINVEYI